MGKLSKPQKSNKHKKLKFVDPFYHGERKERMHSGHNLTPKTTEQGLSRSVKDMMRRARQAKELTKKSRKEKKEIMRKRMLAQISTEGAKREFPAIPDFKQKKGEKWFSFMRRVDAVTLMTVKESQAQASRKTDRDPVMEEKSPKLAKNKEKPKTKKQLKKEKQRKKRESKEDDFQEFKDKVEFGEVVHGLPSLSVRPRHATAEIKKKPAVKSLLLYGIVKNNGESSADPSSSSHVKSVKSAKKTFLTPSQKVGLNKERQRAIDLYRQLKKKAAS